MATGEIVAYHVSGSLGLDLSLTAVAQAATRIGKPRLRGALIHSESGFHYTHPSYTKQLASLGVEQSMSRKGNCLDNAPVESFFGHMKDEPDLTSCYTLDQVRAAVDAYIDHYNQHRYQWNRKA